MHRPSLALGNLSLELGDLLKLSPYTAPSDLPRDGYGGGIGLWETMERQFKLSSPAPPSRAQDRLLPLSNLGRIMKRVLPHDAKVSKGSKEAMQEMVGEFICFVTSEANDLCKEDPQPGKKTLHGAHITGACANLDLAELVAPIRAAALPTSRGSLPDARAKGKIAKQNSFNDLTSLNTFTAVH